MRQRWACWLTFTVLGCSAGASAPVRVWPGIDVLLRDSVHLVVGKRLGVLTHQTGVDHAGVSDVKRLLDANQQVTAIFSPEHGYRGMLDQELVADTVDPLSGIPVFSLYGEVRAPTVDMLALIDVLLIDLQDIGARPYTYISTALAAAAAAAPLGIPVLLLDRPNPIGGVQVQGPVRDHETQHQMNGLLAIPQRHGLTLGELMLLGNAELELGADVRVIPMHGWSRDMWFDQTGLPWVRPSPSMPNLESATHYPGLVFFEATNLSVGRGTELAFRTLGAPWLDPAAVIAHVGSPAGVALQDTIVTPESPQDGKYGGATLPAILFTVTNRGAYDPVATGITIFAAIHALHGDRLEVGERRFAQLIGSGTVWPHLRNGGEARELIAGWAEGHRTFERRRVPYLVYR